MAEAVDDESLGQMAFVRDVIKEALALRAEAGIKVRQPLAQLVVYAPRALGEGQTDIMRDEVNVKRVEARISKERTAPELDTTLTPELKREGIMRDVVRLVQSARKQAGLQVDDRIALGLSCDDEEVTKALSEHTQTIQQETLAETLSDKVEGFSVSARVEGVELNISLHKHNSL